MGRPWTSKHCGHGAQQLDNSIKCLIKRPSLVSLHRVSLTQGWTALEWPSEQFQPGTRTLSLMVRPPESTNREAPSGGQHKIGRKDGRSGRVGSIQA